MMRLLRNYAPQPEEKAIVLCADNDGSESPSFKILNETYKKFQEKGLETYGVYPPTKGEDFNDVLQKSGPHRIRSILRQEGVAISASHQPEQPTTPAQKATQETQMEEQKTLSPQNSQSDPLDPYSREAIRPLSSRQTMSRLTRSIGEVMTCTDGSKKITLEKNLHGFVENIRRERPLVLSAYESQHSDFNRALQQVCQKEEQKLEQEKILDQGHDRNGGFGR